ncbi:MAG TPA: hypothetical protein VNZ45_10260 [Bacteroidia bacterium]|jgi:hypothetical protein|nr:hypothetical protein [Bacteroidia bacterium]
MKKLSIVAAILFAFATVSFAQDAAKTAPAKTDKKAAKSDKKAAPAKADKKADKKAAATK